MTNRYNRRSSTSSCHCRTVSTGIWSNSGRNHADDSVHLAIRMSTCCRRAVTSLSRWSWSWNIEANAATLPAICPIASLSRNAARSRSGPWFNEPRKAPNSSTLDARSRLACSQDAQSGKMSPRFHLYWSGMSARFSVLGLWVGEGAVCDVDMHSS